MITSLCKEQNVCVCVCVPMHRKESKGTFTDATFHMHPPQTPKATAKAGVAVAT